MFSLLDTTMIPLTPLDGDTVGQVGEGMAVSVSTSAREVAGGGLFGATLDFRKMLGLRDRGDLQETPEDAQQASVKTGINPKTILLILALLALARG